MLQGSLLAQSLSRDTLPPRHISTVYALGSFDVPALAWPWHKGKEEMKEENADGSFLKTKLFIHWIA